MSDNKELKKLSHLKALAKGVFTGGVLTGAAIIGLTLDANQHLAQEAAVFVSDKIGMAVDATALKCGAAAVAVGAWWNASGKLAKLHDSTTAPYCFGGLAGMNGTLLAASVQLNAPVETLLLYATVASACGTLAIGKAVERDAKIHKEIAEQKAFEAKYSLTR